MMRRKQNERPGQYPVKVASKEAWLPAKEDRGIEGIVFPSEDVIGAHLTDRKTGRITTIDLPGEFDLVVFVREEPYAESRLRPRNAGATTPVACLTGERVREMLTVDNYQTHSLVRSEPGGIWHLWVHEVQGRPAGAVDLWRLTAVEMSCEGEVRAVQRINFFTVEAAVQFASTAPLPLELGGSPNPRDSDRGEH